MGSWFFKTKKERLTWDTNSLFDIRAKDIDGNEQLLGDLASGFKWVMVVNVASSWGFTNTHYKQMVEIHEKYKHQGFQIFAFPCNQFMWQESKCNLDIKKYAQERKKATFQMFEKIDVNGDHAHDVFKFCRRNSPLYVEKKLESCKVSHGTLLSSWSIVKVKLLDIIHQIKIPKNVSHKLKRCLILSKIRFKDLYWLKNYSRF